MEPADRAQHGRRRRLERPVALEDPEEVGFSDKQVAAVAIPSKTSAPPMTFMHKGKQYIVFATGGGASTSLVALTLPAPTSAGSGGER